MVADACRARRVVQHVDHPTPSPLDPVTRVEDVVEESSACAIVAGSGDCWRGYRRTSLEEAAHVADELGMFGGKVEVATYQDGG
jgi:uridylate kinase